MTAPLDNTPLSIIQDAYFDAGLIALGQAVNSEQIVMGMRKLTDLVNQWQTQGIKLWLNTDKSITLVAGTSTYTLGPAGNVAMVKPLRVLDAWFADQNGIRRPINPLSWSEYVRLSTASQGGSISNYFVDKQASSLNVFFWNTPDTVAALGTAHLLIQSQVTNFIAVTEVMNFPIEWRIALRWGLADEIATGQPQAIMDRCQQRAQAYRTSLEDWDVEDTPVRFTVNVQGYSSRFS